MARSSNGLAWVSVVVGAASVVALPVAIYSSRFSERYELLHAGFVIPVAAGLGLVAIVLARRARQEPLSKGARTTTIVALVLACLAIGQMLIWTAVSIAS